MSQALLLESTCIEKALSSNQPLLEKLINAFNNAHPWLAEKVCTAPCQAAVCTKIIAESGIANHETPRKIYKLEPIFLTVVNLSMHTGTTKKGLPIK